MKKLMWKGMQISGSFGQENTPIGTILAYGGTVLPFGYMWCNGSAVSRVTYSDLFNAIGTSFGAGDGSTTFNLPDYRGRFPQGANGDLGQIKQAGLPNLEGSITSNKDYSGTSYSGSYSFSGVFKPKNISGANYYLSGRTVGNGWSDIYFDASQSGSDPIYGKSNTVQPPAQTCNFIIKFCKSISPAQDQFIDDNQTSSKKTWSSQKINTELGNKIDASKNVKQIIENTGTNDTPLAIKSNSTDKECWLGLENVDGTHWYIGVNSNGNPAFYSDSGYEIALVKDVLLKSGGTITGKITMPHNQYGKDSPLYMNNSDISGVNALYWDDHCEFEEGLAFLRSDGSTRDWLRVTDGQLKLGTSEANEKTIRAVKFADYRTGSMTFASAGAQQQIPLSSFGSGISADRVVCFQTLFWSGLKVIADADWGSGSGGAGLACALTSFAAGTLSYAIIRCVYLD